MRLKLESLIVYHAISKQPVINRVGRFILKNRFLIGGQSVWVYAQVRVLDKQAVAEPSH